MKLWAYTLTEYERVVHLDMDSIVFDNMDELYRLDYELIHTSDYNMGTKPVPPVQGGFLVVVSVRRLLTCSLPPSPD